MKELTRSWQSRLPVVFPDLSSGEIEDIIATVDNILADYEDRLKLDRTESSILALVKNAIKRLNDFADCHEDIIQTEERDELIDFIQSKAMEAGLQVSPGDDITFDLRVW